MKNSNSKNSGRIPILMMLCAIIGFGLMLFPFFSKTVVISKADVHDNRPFAGRLNDEYVGTTLCVNYWLSLDEQPDQAIYHIKYNAYQFVLGLDPWSKQIQSK